MSLADLRPDLLWVIVFGPGYGESIAVRVPPAPGAWLVIDGCLCDGVMPSAGLLKDVRTRWSGVVLTHPHKDHRLGLAQVIGLAHTDTAFLGCADPSIASDDWQRSVDPDDHAEGGVEHLIATIHRHWQSREASRWVVRRGDTRRLGEASVRALHPTDELVAERPAPGNRLASALLLEWRGARVLLGSDVESADWETIGAWWQTTSQPALGAHQTAKVPHHGSLGAVHAEYATGARDRLWIVTPFSASRKLPRFEDDQGVAALLAHVERLHLTGLPVAHALQGPAPARSTRADLRDGRQPVPVSLATFGGVAIRESPAAGPPQQAFSCFVAAGLDENGTVREVRHGAGSVIVS